jgi:hypothetical protein
MIRVVELPCCSKRFDRSLTMAGVVWAVVRGPSVAAVGVVSWGLRSLVSG